MLKDHMGWELGGGMQSLNCMEHNMDCMTQKDSRPHVCGGVTVHCLKCKVKAMHRATDASSGKGNCFWKSFAGEYDELMRLSNKWGSSLNSRNLQRASGDHLRGPR